jgi:putative transposase
MNRKHYSTDLTDREWAIVEPLVPAVKPGGRPCRWERREILNGIFYMLRAGGSWRLLPHDFPPWQTVYHSFRLWRREGTVKRLHDQLRVQTRVRLGRKPDATAAIIDSQSVKTAERGGPVATTAAKRSRGASATW